MKFLTFLFLAITLNAYGISGSVSMQIQSNYKHVSTNENRASSITSLSVFGQKFGGVIAGSVGVVTNLKEVDNRTDIIDPSFSYTKTSPYKNFTLSNTLVWSLPVSRGSRKIAENKSSFLLVSNISKNLKLWNVPLVGTIGLTNSINFHRYESNPFGQSNTQHAHQIKGALSLQLTEKIAFSHSMGVGKAFTYGGAGLNNFFLSDTLIISMGDVNLSLGHSNGGDLLSPNGQNYNFSLFNIESSSFHVGVNLSF